MILSGITAIYFDLDKTLIPEDEGTDQSTDKALYATCLLGQERFGIDPEGLRLAVRTHAKDLWARSPYIQTFNKLGISKTAGLTATFETMDVAIKQWAREYRFETWKGALGSVGITGTDNILLLSNQFPVQRQLRYVPYPDVVSTLKLLQDNYKLGTLTNGASDLQHLKLETANIEKFFSTIIVSSDVGIGKPDPKIFLHAIQVMEVKPEQVLFVDDSVQNIKGATAVGMEVIQINRDLPQTNDLLITSFYDLLPEPLH